MAAYFDVGVEVKEDEAGFTFPLSCLFTYRSIDRALTFRPWPGDVILSSYPKCDSRVVDSILWKILYLDLKHPPVCSTTESFIPCMEMTLFDGFSSMYDYMGRHHLPKLYKTYLPCKFIKFCSRAKYIYIMQTPWEACASYYTLLRLTQTTIEPFEEFFNAFLKGNVPYGSYFKHIIPWNKKIEENNVLVLCREHVEHNPRSAMFAVAAFLGGDYLSRLIDNKEIEESILCSIEAQHGSSDCSKSCYAHPYGTCVRYHSETLLIRSKLKPLCSDIQLKDMIEAIASKFKDSGTEYLWLSLLKKQVPALFT